MPFAFAPFHYYFIAPIALSVLLLVWLYSSTKQAFIQGLLFGFGLFGIGISWVYISIHRFGGTDIFLASLITALFIVVLSLFPALQGYCLARFYPEKRYTKVLFAFPASFVLSEWIRSWLFTGFPWLLVGYSQTNSPLKGFLPFIGTYGVSFLVALSAALLIIVLKHRGKARYLSIIGLIVLWIAGELCSFIPWTQPYGKPMTVSIIQGDVPQELKWSPDQVLPTINHYIDLTKPHWKSDLILWPEAAIPLLLREAQPVIDQLSQQAEKNNTTLILGIPIEQNQKFYNAAIAIGNGSGTYYKKHLVPFGEYLPLEKLLHGLINFFNLPMSDFIPGPAHQKLITINNNTNVAIFICYEVAYASLVRQDLPDARILITLSNDAWFGDSFAADQHFQIAQTRAIETGRYMLVSTNNGLSGIIAPNGKVINTLPKFKSAVLSATIRKMYGTTRFDISGNYPILIGSFFLLIIAFRRKRGDSRK